MDIRKLKDEVNYVKFLVTLDSPKQPLRGSPIQI